MASKFISALHYRRGFSREFAFNSLVRRGVAAGILKEKKYPRSFFRLVRFPVKLELARGPSLLTLFALLFYFAPRTLDILCRRQTTYLQQGPVRVLRFFAERFRGLVPLLFLNFLFPVSNFKHSFQVVASVDVGFAPFSSERSFEITEFLRWCGNGGAE